MNKNEVTMSSIYQLRVVLFSFGFKYGTPVDVNMLWDVRFLPNPYWVEELRPDTGKSPGVSDYVLESKEGRIFMEQLLPVCNTVIDLSCSAKKNLFTLESGVPADVIDPLL
jgi:UPF0042 nucleotide-binding protein